MDDEKKKKTNQPTKNHLSSQNKSKKTTYCLALYQSTVAIQDLRQRNEKKSETKNQTCNNWLDTSKKFICDFHSLSICLSTKIVLSAPLSLSLPEIYRDECVQTMSVFSTNIHTHTLHTYLVDLCAPVLFTIYTIYVIFFSFFFFNLALLIILDLKPISRINFVSFGQLSFLSLPYLSSLLPSRLYFGLDLKKNLRFFS